MIDITGLDKAVILAALYNAAKPQGLGVLHYTPDDMTRAEAAKIVANTELQLYFDYIKGRVLKVNLSGDTLNPNAYDRDNGAGAAARVLALLRREEGNSPSAGGQEETDGS